MWTYVHLATSDYLKDAVGPLVALLRSAVDIRQIAIYNIVSVTLVSPSLLVPFASHFLVRSSDPQFLTLIFPDCGLPLKSIILSKLGQLLSQSISATCPHQRPSYRPLCAIKFTNFPCAFKVLLNQVTSTDNIVVSEVFTVIRYLIQQAPTSHQTTVMRLAKTLMARATSIWLAISFAGTD